MYSDCLRVVCVVRIGYSTVISKHTQNVLDALSRRQPELIEYRGLVCIATFPSTFIAGLPVLLLVIDALHQKGKQN